MSNDDTKQRLREALARPRASRPTIESSRREFDDLRHTLDHIASILVSGAPTAHTRAAKLLKSLILECAPRAALLHDVMVRLGASERYANDERIDLAISIVSGVRKDLDALEEAPRHFIYQLCRDHLGVCTSPLFELDPWDIVEHTRPESPPLLFDLGELRMAVAALRANARGSEQSGSHYCLSYREGRTKAMNGNDVAWAEIIWLEEIPSNPESLWKEYVDEGDACVAINAVLDAAQKSLENKHLYRGLPQVLLFGVENRAKHVALLHKDKWRPLWDDSLAVIGPDIDAWQKWIGVHRNRDNNFRPNYGWRFFFSEDTKATNASDANNDSESKQVPAHEARDSKGKTTVFLCDDRVDADWIPIVQKELERHFNVEVLKPTEAPSSGQALVDQWASTISARAKDSKCDVVTDSEFSTPGGTLRDGGERLLRALAEKKALRRGLVYSVAPSFDAQYWRQDAKADFSVGQLHKHPGHIPEDARRITRFIQTGQLEPLGSLIVMIQRMVAVCSPLLDAVHEAPWVLARQDSQWQEEWRIQLDPWRPLMSSFGDSVPVPFSAETWRYFTTSKHYEIEFDDEVRRRLTNIVRDSDLNGKEGIIENLRGALCPVTSVMRIVEKQPRSWEGKRPTGAIRVLMDLTLSPHGFQTPDNDENDVWLNERVDGIPHRDVGLKYREFLRRYRVGCLAKLKASDFVNLKSAALKQISGLQEFLNYWEAGA